METKVCKKCGRELPISEFYVHKRMGDGHLSFCKDCVKSRVHKYREKNIEKVREYDRNRPNAKDRKRKERISLMNNKKRLKKYKEQRNMWSKLNRYKRNAHNKLKNALLNGNVIKLIKCEVCGKTNCTIQGHHYDYSKPLDVIWLCTECHGKVHRQYNKLQIDIEQIKRNRENGNIFIKEGVSN